MIVGTTNHKGAVAELAIAAKAAALGIGVLWPMIEHGRYDLALELGDRIARVQCKWGRLCGDVVKVNLATSRHTPLNGYVRGKYGIDEIDAVAVYCGELDRCFLIPIEEAAGRSAIHLRLTPARNNQRAAINFAADYEFSGAVAQLARALPWHGRGRRFESGQLHLTHPDVEAVGADEFGRAYARFLQRAAAGESFLVTRRGRPMARVSPPDPPCGNPDQAV